MKIKVMQYNIRTGFRNEKPPFCFEANRLLLAQKIVKKLNPDILLLNEAYFESDNSAGILMNYGALFHFPHYAHGNYKKGMSPFWGSALLSKYPIVKIENKNAGLKGWLSCQIKVGKKVLNVLLTHISPIPFLSSKQQVASIKQLLKRKKKNIIFSGDFNALSPLDHYQKEKLLASWKKFDTNASNTVYELLKREAISEVLRTGLIDTYKEKNTKFDFTIPTDFLSKDKGSGIRIDYIFCSTDFKVLDSVIVKNKLTELASDHYPIYSLLEIK